jgi:hypothetical protein
MNIAAVVIAVVAGYSIMLCAAMEFDQRQQERNEPGALVGAEEQECDADANTPVDVKSDSPAKTVYTRQLLRGLRPIN